MNADHAADPVILSANGLRFQRGHKGANVRPDIPITGTFVSK